MPVNPDYPTREWNSAATTLDNAYDCAEPGVHEPLISVLNSPNSLSGWGGTRHQPDNPQAEDQILRRAQSVFPQLMPQIDQDALRPDPTALAEFVAHGSSTFPPAIINAFYEVREVADAEREEGLLAVFSGWAGTRHQPDDPEAEDKIMPSAWSVLPQLIPQTGPEAFRPDLAALFEFVVHGSSSFPVALVNALCDLSEAADDASEEGFPGPSDTALENASRLLRAMYEISPRRFEVYPTPDGEIAIDAPGGRGRSVLLLCDSGGGALCLVNMNGNHRRARYSTAGSLPDGFVREALADLQRQGN